MLCAPGSETVLEAKTQGLRLAIACTQSLGYSAITSMTVKLATDCCSFYIMIIMVR